VKRILAIISIRVCITPFSRSEQVLNAPISHVVKGQPFPGQPLVVYPPSCHCTDSSLGPAHGGPPTPQPQPPSIVSTNCTLCLNSLITHHHKSRPLHTHHSSPALHSARQPAHYPTAHSTTRPFSYSPPNSNILDNGPTCPLVKLQ